MDRILIGILNLIASLIVVAWCKKGGRAVLNNVSKDEQYKGVQALWAMRQVTYNNMEANHKESTYCILYNVGFLPSGPIPGLSSLDFLGTSDSYSVMVNDGSLDGYEAVTWLFYINSNFRQDAVIMQYEGDENGPGMQIRIGNNKRMCVRFFACDTSCVETDYCSSKYIEIVPGTWHFVGITFNRLWPSDQQMDITDISNSDTFQIDVTLMRPFGNIRFGSAWDGSDPFRGLISCVQYFDTSIIGKVLDDVESECDPDTWLIDNYDEVDPDKSTDIQVQTLSSGENSLNFLSASIDEHVVDDDYYNMIYSTESPITTTEAVTSAPTTTMLVVTTDVDVTSGTTADETTSSTLTEDDNTSATTADKTTSNTLTGEEVTTLTTMATTYRTIMTSPTTATTSETESITSTTVITTSASPVTTSTVQPILYDFPVVRNCMEFKNIADDSIITVGYRSLTISSLTECARFCVQDTRCRAFSVDNVYTVCELASQVSLVTLSGYTVFSLL